MSITSLETGSVVEADHRGGKYLTFALGDEQYGLEIIKVREIIGFIEVVSVPRMPSYIRGVINLRGHVIPVIDLRRKFNMTSKEVTEQTCIIVVEVNTHDRVARYGIVVDQVQEVLDIPSGHIEDTPNLGAGLDTDFILGIGKMGDTVKILLDIDRVLADSDFENCLEC